MNKHNLEYAGFFVRSFATLLDWIFFSLLFLVLFQKGFDSFWGWDDLPISNFDFEHIFLVWDVYGWKKFFLTYFQVFAEPLFSLVVTLLFWVIFAATPGKMIFRIKILDARTGKSPSIFQFFVRYLCYFLSAFFLMLGFFWIIWDKRKQGWHDKIAKTVVVRRSKDKVVFSEQK